ncbi:hypothetical protein RO3G_15129 [Rhizopus delemar RA 99-880]|uniref:Uncharacterized protein n=1 Tax=Rhizopus delemar (strain RA 99-880 / ATCC MYA-4621 / FGSC 9543 / NRRL 43880) TaxID=246409 RepID=I1CPN8_RHIO9|nr:hypothetical protein RO3G_15129 [Rhizopus delemar RA 99-880]|eukprot:EIE90418.1 hypothetical protein RO3G_15129 [Rhizopus delemar RA 99-880]
MPTKAELKANLAMNAIKKRKLFNQNITMNEVEIKNMDSIDESSTSKKKHGYVQEIRDMDEENEKIENDVVDRIKTIQDDLSQFKNKVREVTMHIVSLNGKEEEAKNLEFLEEILRAAYKMYSSHIDKYKYEDGFSQLFIWPYLGIIAKSITISNCNSEFESGQPLLQSMTQQLKANGIHSHEKSCYKTDGLIKLFGIKQLELLLLETSGHFRNTDSVKLNFDHHKGMFGLLAMLKCIADEFHFANIEKFCKVKVFFYTQQCLLEESVESIVELRKDHKANHASCRYDSNPPTSLQDMVNPIILKLTKSDDSSGMNLLYNG